MPCCSGVGRTRLGTQYAARSPTRGRPRCGHGSQRRDAPHVRITSLRANPPKPSRRATLGPETAMDFADDLRDLIDVVRRET
jgi:hypothetical protein